MRLSINTNAIGKRFSELEFFQMIAQAGFEAVDYSFCGFWDADSPWQLNDREAYAARLVEAAKQNGLCLTQAHAECVYNWDDPNVIDEKIIPTVKENIRLCSLLGIDKMVVHGLSHPAVRTPVEVKLEANIRYFNELKPVARQYGVKIALENLRYVCTTPDEYEYLMNTLDDDVFIACVDLGHSVIAGQDITQVIRRLGHDRVKLMHCHDNALVTDDHMIPGTGKINWGDVLQALADIRYTGDFSLELIYYVNGFLDNEHGFDDDFAPKALEIARISGAYLRDKLQKMLAEN